MFDSLRKSCVSLGSHSLLIATADQYPQGHLHRLMCILVKEDFQITTGLGPVHTGQKFTDRSAQATEATGFLNVIEILHRSFLGQPHRQAIMKKFRFLFGNSSTAFFYQIIRFCKVRVIQLHLFRHGSVDTGGRRRVYGHTDMPLSATGLAQARQGGQGGHHRDRDGSVGCHHY